MVTKEKFFVKRKKWTIKFVPYSESETGILFRFRGGEKAAETAEAGVFILPLEEEELEDFCLDLMKGIIARCDVKFSNDVKPKHTKKELVKRLQDLENLAERMASGASASQYII